MGEPEAVRATERFKAQLLRLERGASTALINAYAPIALDLTAEITVLLEQEAVSNLSFAEFKKLNRFQSLQRQIQREIERYSVGAATTITGAQEASVSLAQSATRGVVNAALPPGVDLPTLARAGLEWNRLPVEAFQNFVGIAGDGAPLANLLDPLGVEIRIGVTQAVGEGIALGRGPRETARLITNQFGVGLTRSLRISRTETLRAYREASRVQYAVNQNIVKGYRRIATLDDQTCMACIALDGTLYENNVPLNEHVSGRCAMIPEVVTYRDLGLDVDQPPDERELGQDWFRNQSPGLQEDMMGKRGFNAWNEGKFDLGDMANITDDPVWGQAATVKPLKELIR